MSQEHLAGAYREFIRCQSCSIPLKIQELMGTTADGQLNSEFCIMCYKDGNFTDPEITKDQMIDKVIQIICKSSKVDESVIRTAMTVEFAKLKRWQS